MSKKSNTKKIYYWQLFVFDFKIMWFCFLMNEVGAINFFPIFATVSVCLTFIFIACGLAWDVYQERKQAKAR